VFHADPPAAMWIGWSPLYSRANRKYLAWYCANQLRPILKLLFRILNVSLPQERFQEIKPMMTVQTTNGLFLTCTQKIISLYIQNMQSIIWA
jgi:hypothetical protein